MPRCGLAAATLSGLMASGLMAKCFLSPCLGTASLLVTWLVLAWNHLLGGICLAASFIGLEPSPFPGFAVLSLAAILALMMVFPDFVFPKASCLPEHGNDARLLHRDLLFAQAALRQRRRSKVRERQFLAMSASARQSRALSKTTQRSASWLSVGKCKASFAAPGPRSQIRDLGWRLPYSGYHLHDPSRRQPSAAFGLRVDALRNRDAADNRDQVARPGRRYDASASR